MNDRNDQTIQNLNQTDAISDLPLANQLAEQMKAGTGSNEPTGVKDVRDIVTGAGLGAMPHVK